MDKLSVIFEVPWWSYRRDELPSAYINQHARNHFLGGMPLPALSKRLVLKLIFKTVELGDSYSSGGT
jgi:hypothetical protein